MVATHRCRMLASTSRPGFLGDGPPGPPGHSHFMERRMCFRDLGRRTSADGSRMGTRGAWGGSREQPIHGATRNHPSTIHRAISGGDRSHTYRMTAQERPDRNAWMTILQTASVSTICPVMCGSGRPTAFVSGHFPRPPVAGTTPPAMTTTACSRVDHSCATKAIAIDIGSLRGRAGVRTRRLCIPAFAWPMTSHDRRYGDALRIPYPPPATFDDAAFRDSRGPTHDEITVKNAMQRLDNLRHYPLQYEFDSRFDHARYRLLNRR